MITHLPGDSERIRETNRCFQIEHKYERGIGYEWRAIEWHATFTEAIQAAAYRDIHSLPNDDFERWSEESCKRLEAYQQVLTAKLEPRSAQIDQGRRE